MTEFQRPLSLGYHTDLALRLHEGGFCEVLELAELGRIVRVATPSNPTFWWGNFLLMPRPPRVGELPTWLAAFRQAHPQARHVTFGLDTTDGEGGGAEQEFVDAGFSLHRDTVLTTSQTVPPRTLNTDLIFRPLDTAQDADWQAALALRMAVNAADPEPHEAAGYQTFAARKLDAARAAQHRGRGAMFGAFGPTGQMYSGLGVFSADGAHRAGGVTRYQNVETHPETRSLGLAGTLVHRAGEWARTHLNAQTLVIVADPAYHAQRLYERAGFRPTEIQTGWERPPQE